ncbi:MAG: bifunctional DNA-formamidopyrimidine glycosylase/DNA-(apurinic or apyrimidinic site) lyase [Candidatus Omnitrophica bacterium]|nr:bifunctional DNA-formamidopyrimidine glycosylase/DNA-(apurinic or apyrimidinic site) lyase [Candidatus Omnitrophota bacterium]
MPELPEVETITKDLQKIITGKKIIKVCVHNPKVIREPGLKAFKQALENVIVKQVFRRAKLLIFKLSNGLFLTAHLKMTGQLVYPGGGKNSRVSFHLSGGGILDFNDQRLFGELRVVKDWKKLKFVQSLGPEPFDLTYADFRHMLSKKKTKIKPLLLDQGFIAGIGNIYAAEILFHAKINPARLVSELTEAEKTKLFCQIQKVLAKAIKYGGSSVDDYVRLSGKRGDYARFHQVYGREGKPCLICKTIIQRIAQAGRGTYFCPQCQK